MIGGLSPRCLGEGTLMRNNVCEYGSQGGWIMRVGTFLPTYWTDYGATTVREAVEEAARAAEALGYASVWANDHVIVPAHQADVGHIIEPLTTLASLIHLVPLLQLGTSALVLPQRH